MVSARKLQEQSVHQLLDRALRTPEAVADLSDSDLDLTLRAIRRVRLLGRLAADLQASGTLELLSDIAKDQLLSALVLADSRARVARWELDRIAWALSDEPISTPVVMKGCTYLLLNLPNARGRIFADVDLIFPESELTLVEKRLNAYGWNTRELTPYDQNYYRKWTHELPPLVHNEREVEIDLHHNIMPRTARLKPDSSKLLESACPVAGSPYRVLADVDIVLHAMSHLMFDGDLADKLRDLVDIKDLLIHFASADGDFWERLLARAADLDLCRPTYYSIRYAEILLHCPIPSFVTSAIRRWAPPMPIVWLMDRLVPGALYPPHPDYRNRVVDFGRLLLYMRSHWIRMPPWLLVYHLSYKFYARRLRRVSHAAAGGTKAGP